MANKDIGQNTSKSNNSEFDEDKFIQGKLKRNLKFWREVIKPFDFILNMIQSGYKIPFHTTPDPHYFDNRLSALRRKSFVEFQIRELLENGCISEVPDCPEFEHKSTSCCGATIWEGTAHFGLISPKQFYHQNSCKI